MKRLSVAILIMFPLLFALLGTWQIGRYYEKKNIESKQHQVKIILKEINPEQLNIKDLSYAEAIIPGIFMHRKELHFLRYMGRQKGYFVYTAFTTTEGKNILVNMGWISAENKLKDRDKYYSITEINGIIQNSFKDSWQFIDNDTKSNEWFYLKKAEIENYLDLKLEDYTVVRDKEDSTFSSGIHSIHYVSQVDLSRHIEYAITWFSLMLISSVILWMRSR